MGWSDLREWSVLRGCSDLPASGNFKQADQTSGASSRDDSETREPGCEGIERLKGT